MTLDAVYEIVKDIQLGYGCELTVKTDLQGGDRLYLQVRCWRPDTVTGAMAYGYGGKGYLSPFMVKSEVVALAFGLYKGYLEHEARESFKWRGRRVYGPHINVEALWEVARRVEHRPQPAPPRLDGTGHGVEA